MKAYMLTTFCLIVLVLVVAGCVNGNVQLASMTATDIRDSFKVGVTTMDDVKSTLGEPLRKAVVDTNVTWYYRYQKVTGRVFNPFLPIRPQDDIRGRLDLSFGASNVLEHVDYLGGQ